MSEPTTSWSRAWSDELPREFSGFRRICFLIGDCFQLVVVGVVLEFLLFDGTQIPPSLRVSAIALLLIGVSKSKGWLLLIAIQLSLFLREPGDHGIGTFLFCFLSLAVVAYTCRVHGARRTISQWFALGIPSLLAQRPSNHEIATRGRSTEWRRHAGFVVGVTILVGSVLAAMLLVTHLPLSTGARLRWVERAIAGESTPWLAANLGVLFLLVIVVCGEAAWRQMTPAQAKIYLRSGFMLEHHRDLRSIVRRRLKMR